MYINFFERLFLCILTVELYIYKYILVTPLYAGANPDGNIGHYLPYNPDASGQVYINVHV